jgi:hypothetical protein
LSSVTYAYAAPFSSRSTRWLVRETAPEYGAPGAHPDRSEADEADALTELGEEIMTLAEQIQAQTHRLLLLIADFDRREGWKLYGFGSCAEWLAYSARLDKVTAREKVRVARALVGLPETSAAMARGELSFSQVRAITRVADDENELELLAHAGSTSAAGLERLVRSWRRLGREDEAALEARRHASRCLSVFPDDEGGYVVRGRLDPEVGVLLMRAIEAASDALYRGSVPETTPEQRRADALALLAERALAAGFGKGDERRDGDDSEAPADDSAESSCAKCTTDSERDGDSAESREDRPEFAGAWRSERYMVVLHVDEATLSADAEPGRSDLEDGTRVSAESFRRLSCDASLVRVVHGRSGGESRVEGKTRTIPPRLRRALEVRDRGCRFPGCGSRFTDGHHIRHWADGGATRLDNLILLCKTHHRLLHEGGFGLEADPTGRGQPIFKSPRGVRIPEVPPRVKLNGLRVGTGTGTGESPGRPQRWEEDVPLALYLRALDSLS